MSIQRTRHAGKGARHWVHSLKHCPTAAHHSSSPEQAAALVAPLLVVVKPAGQRVQAGVGQAGFGPPPAEKKPWLQMVQLLLP